MANPFGKLVNRRVEPVVIEGETLYLRSLTAGQSLRIGAGGKAGNSLDYLAESICSEDGSSLFTSTKEARAALEDISLSAMTQLMTALNKLNGLGGEDDPKNSDETQ